MARNILIDECSAMIRKALKQGFPKTTFSVRKTRSTYSHNIGVRWTDGPTTKQVDAILDQFESKGFDGMTDCEYSCGERLLNGEKVSVSGGYVSGNRSVSENIRQQIIAKLAQECGIEVTTNQYGGISPDPLVPFAWHDHYRENTDIAFTLDEFLNTKHVLASDSNGRSEWFAVLVGRIEHTLSFESQQPISPEILPEYIDVNETVSTGRAEEFEERQPMFEGHVAYEEQRKSATVAPAVPAPVLNCRIGRSYPRPELVVTIQ